MTSWKETSAGNYERPFDSIERFFLAIGRGSQALNREHWAVNIFAHFESDASREETEKALKHAWITMRYYHPSLACIAREETKLYQVPDPSTLDAWLEKSFIIESASTSKDDLLASIRPSVLASLHYLPHTSEILIHTSYWRIDLVGAISLLQNFFSAVAKSRPIDFGNEAANLSPGRDEAASYSQLDHLGNAVEAEQVDKAATDLVMNFLRNLPSAGLPAQNVNQMPGGTRRAELVLDEAKTSAIVSACKQRGLTVTTALHAALLVAMQAVAPLPPSSSSKYTSFGIFNVRPSLKPPFDNSAVHPAALHIVGLPLVLQLSSYADLALQLKQFYKQRIPPSVDSDIDEKIVVPATSKMADFVGQPPPVDFPAPREPLLSSVGVVDRYLKSDHGSIKVKDFWVGVEMMTPQIIFYLWTWQGRMTLSAFYNETFYHQNFVQQFLQKGIDTLAIELNSQINGSI
ncbi:MAG: hypothetical protein Q9195_005819 [Heterodermia aff. obscurata]